MKCPLKREIFKDYYGNSYDNSPDCLKEECAWWEEKLESCDPTGLALPFTAACNVLGRICDRMPKDLAPKG